MKDEQKKKEVAEFLNKIYKDCGCDYIKYVLKVEELEKQGILKTEYIPREENNNIWNNRQ